MAKLPTQTKTYTDERQGQIDFFNSMKLTPDVLLIDNTDGVYKGTLFEFKLNIPNINAVLFQAIKYLSRMRIKGESVPKNIMLVSLNTETAYVFDSNVFLNEIEQVYIGAASKNNAAFSTNIKPQTIVYNSPTTLVGLLNIINTEAYTKINIDMFCVIGWAERYYNEVPQATKIAMFDELRNPQHFAEFIYAWKGKEDDFKYIMDCLNDRMHRKELGAFYTPKAYCLKATELVRRAIAQIPAGHDYIILDRCAGTGNLEEFLTDKEVNKITISELDRYVLQDFKAKYLKDKATVISTFYSDKNFNEITCGELEKYKTDINIHDYLFDNELSHAVVNTFELKEWIVLNDRIGDKVKMIIPPPCEISNTDSLVNGGDALSQEFITGTKSNFYNMTDEYFEKIKELNDYVKDEKTNIIMFENPPYSDSSADNIEQKGFSRSINKNYVQTQMKSTRVTSRDLANQFIWSAWNNYLLKSDDYYIILSPIKYWKSLCLCDKKYIDGYLFNRKYFHASPSSVSCILWKNENDVLNILNLKAYEIDENTNVIFFKDIKIKKVYKPISDLRKPFGKGCVIGYYYADSYSIRPAGIGLRTTSLPGGGNTELHDDNYIEKLPLFCAKLYPQKNWYERDIYFTTADGGTAYTQDNDFLRACLIYTCLSPRNHCLSFNGSDGRFYRNELCFDEGTLARQELQNHTLTAQENNLLDMFNAVMNEAKLTKKYNSAITYGTYQIEKDLNTRDTDANGQWVYDYPQLNTNIIALKTKLAMYYEEVIQPKLFEYELLK